MLSLYFFHRLLIELVLLEPDNSNFKYLESLFPFCEMYEDSVAGTCPLLSYWTVLATYLIYMTGLVWTHSQLWKVKRVSRGETASFVRAPLQEMPS